MKVKFWGTRGSIAVPGKDTTRFGGNTTCVEINLESGLRILIDSGTGIRPLGEELLANGESLDIHLLITHIHWDHITGFPFFAPIFRPEARITIDGYPTCMKGLRVPFDNRLGMASSPSGLTPSKPISVTSTVYTAVRLNWTGWSSAVFRCNTPRAALATVSRKGTRAWCSSRTMN